MDFTLYNNRKTKLQQTITTTLSVLQSLNLTSAYKRMTDDAARLADERFNLVIIGEFSRGKSTFINALLGRSILPASANPTTNIISKIVYGKQPKYVLFYKDGKQQEISKEAFDLIKAQTEDKPDKFSLLKDFVGKLKHEESHVDFGNIDHAEISYPLSFCENQVDVVDTPGTNDLNVGRIEITYRYLRQAEAAILVLSATQPLTRTEKEFLVEQVVGNNIKDIFIVINYKDEVIGQEERVVKHVLDNLQDVQDFSQRIFIVRSKQALLYRRKQAGEALKTKALLNCPATLKETGIEELETALARFLSEEKGNAKLKKYAERCYLALREAEHGITVQKEGLSHSLDDLKAKLFEERPKFMKTKRMAAQITQGLQIQLESRQMDIEQLADLTANKIKQAAIGSIDGYDGNISELSGLEIKYVVEKAVTPIQKQFIKDINDLQNKLVQEEVAQAAEKLKQIWQDMDFDAAALPITNRFAALGEIHNVPTNANNNDSLGTAVGSGLIVGALFGGIFGLLAGAAAWFLSGGANPFEDKKRKIKEQVLSQFNSNLRDFSKNIVDQYNKSVQQICQEMQTEVDERVGEMNDQLQSLIQQKESRQQNVDDVLADLDKKQQAIAGLQNDLNEVLR
nr:dynamin family protein [Phascolarctobacterium succinatutens]